MKLEIVGIGEMFDLKTGTMQDTLQVQTPAGVISVPTTNEAAQALISAVMGNGQTVQVDHTEQGFMPAPDNPLGQQLAEAYEMVPPGVTMRTVPQAQMDLSQPIHEEFPEGADVFGGDVGVGWLDGEPQDLGGLSEVDPEIAAKAAIATKEAKSRLGVKRNNPDRSGVPSIGISRVNAKGFPDLPPPPDDTMEDEDDPGEQI